MKSVCVALLICSSLYAGALDRDAFTFTKYDLNVRVEPEQQRLGVRGTITLRNDSSSPQRSLSLQISSTLNWSSIRFGDKLVEFVSQIYTSDIDHTGALSEAIVVLPQAVAPKQTVELEIGYEGVIPQDATRLTRIGVPEDEAKHAEWDGISRAFTAVRGVGYVAWYPVEMQAVSLSDGDAVTEAIARWKQREAKAEIKIAFTYSVVGTEPNDLLCIGAEGPKMQGTIGAPQEIHLQCSFAPLGLAVPTFVAAPYSQINGKEVVIHYLPDHKVGADDYSSAIDEVLPLIIKWFGDHRWSADVKPHVADLPDANDTPFESGNMLLTSLSGTDTRLLLSAAERLTTVLFPSPRLWIHKGLGGYAEVRLVEEKESRQAAINYLHAHRTAIVELEKFSSGKSKDDSLISSPDELRVQTKSMYVWWMLRDMVGENALYSALHNYKSADDTDEKYMQKLIEAQAHRDLQWFFDDWVYQDRGLPEFGVVSVYPSRLASGGYMVTVTVENLGDAGAEIPVTLHAQDSEASGKLIVAGKSKASIRIQSPSLPQDVTLNDGSVPESGTSNDVYKMESTNH